MEIIAHRGSSFLAPENTLAAVELAWQEGADAVEGDFRLTADGHIVCMHDADLKRTAGIDRRVDQCTLAELRSYDVGSWKAPQFAGQHMPTLAELLATVPPGKRYFIEVKCGAEIIPELARSTAACGLADHQMVFISLEANVIETIKKKIPQCPAYWVVEFKQKNLPLPPGESVPLPLPLGEARREPCRTGRGEERTAKNLPIQQAPQTDWTPTPDELLRTAEQLKIDGLDLMATTPMDTSPIDVALVNQIKSTGLNLAVWTVDDPPLARHLIDLGITSITTNRPAWLRNQLRH